MARRKAFFQKTPLFAGKLATQNDLCSRSYGTNAWIAPIAQAKLENASRPIALSGPIEWAQIHLGQGLKMKVLFLDIDGVLNNEKTKERLGPEAGIFANFIGIDKRLLKLFQDWLADKPIEVVISSSWRTDERMLKVLADHGLRWLDITPNRGYRGREIEEWLKGKHVARYAILDDIQQFYGHQYRHFVQTSYIHGLRPKNLKKLEAILKLDPPSSNGRTPDFESGN